MYFPRRVIPMLPEELSNELCSLKADVDRLCMACDMEISPQGAIKSYTFYPAVMHSRARLTYTQVWAWLSEPASAKGAQPKALLPHLANLYALYQALAGARGKRGAIDFDTPELAIEFDDHGKITRDRAGAAQRRAQADRGVHAGGERLRGGLPDRAPASDAVPRARPAAAGQAGGAARLPVDVRAAAWAAATSPSPATTRSCSRARASAPTTTSSSRCCCARCRRRSTGPTTKGTSASRSTRTRTSRRRSGATRTCSCTARSRRRSRASSTSRRT